MVWTPKDITVVDGRRWIMCVMCVGSGRVMDYTRTLRSPDGHGTIYATMPCPDCEGTGRREIP